MRSRILVFLKSCRGHTPYLSRERYYQEKSYDYEAPKVHSVMKGVSEGDDVNSNHLVVKYHIIVLEELHIICLCALFTLPAMPFKVPFIEKNN